MTRLVVWGVAAALAVGAFAACSGLGSSAGHPGTPRTGISFVAGTPGTRGANVVLVAAAGGRPRALTRGGPPVAEAAWTADGRELVFTRQTQRTTANGRIVGHIDMFVQATGGAPRLVHRCPLTCRPHDFAWSPDGRRIAFVVEVPHGALVGPGDVVVMNADGSGFHVVCDVAVCGQGLSQPRWSPDGSLLVFSNMGTGSFFTLGPPLSRIWVAGADEGKPRALTQPGCRPGHAPLVGCAYDANAAWSPDGRRIAFSRVSFAGPASTTAGSGRRWS